MRKSITKGLIGTAVVAPIVLSTGVAAVAAPENDQWTRSNIAMNLGADASGAYADAGGARFDGTGQIVFDIDGAFTGGNSLMKDADGKSKVAAEYCFGLASDSTAWPSLCEKSDMINTGYLYKGPSYFSTLPGSSAPSLRCVDSAKDPCHELHGTATAGAVVGQRGIRWELNADGSYTQVSTAGAASGAKVVQMKVGGGTSSGANDAYGWSGESVVNALNWIDNAVTTELAYRGKVAAVTLSVAGDAIGANGACSTIGQAIDAAAGRLTTKGIAVIMAAGNEGVDSLGAWNCGKNVITVGATKTLQPHVRASYSNHAASTRLYAPVGEGDYLKRDGVLLPYKSDGTFYAMGTSFAAPQVAGAFAVLREKFAYDPTVDELVDLLAKTGTPVTGPGSPASARDIDIQAALNATP
ncbi:S8 family serine peptidase [Leifsonia sp. NPDC056665]|uniref:S8 family serine peptidase n=1 Tax=Leifsonia sp. NPDC056665 TaxID=3345901 RepID=UPI0036B52380